jgi:EAL domain-containing protein (putative c-di-GMP-specific phosphodiesterase class I)
MGVVNLEGRLQSLAARLYQEAAADPVAGAFVRALCAGTFTFERETWFQTASCRQSLHQRTPGEMLIRAYDDTGQKINPQDPIFRLNAMGLHKELDHLIVLSALALAREEDWTPVSINLSARHAEDDLFWLRLHRDIEAFFGDSIAPDEIIFEFLEDTAPACVAHETLELMQALGYRFALDDLSDAPEDRVRQGMLLPYCSFAKYDGAVVQKILEDRDAYDGRPSRLMAFHNAVRAALPPQGSVVMERVGSAADADRLRMRFNVEHVQGRDLEESGFDEFRDSIRGGLTP